MTSIRALLLPTAVLAVVLGSPVHAAPLFGGDDLQRNGAVSRHMWTPDLATGELGGLRVSAGVALGLRDALQSNLGRSVTPALTVALTKDSSASLLPGGNRGVMLVLQMRP